MNKLKQLMSAKKKTVWEIVNKKKNSGILTINQCVSVVHFQSFTIFEPVNFRRWIPSWTALHYSGVTNFNDSSLWTLCNYRKTTRSFINWKETTKWLLVSFNINWTVLCFSFSGCGIWFGYCKISLAWW